MGQLDGSECLSEHFWNSLSLHAEKYIWLTANPGDPCVHFVVDIVPKTGLERAVIRRWSEYVAFRESLRPLMPAESFADIPLPDHKVPWLEGGAKALSRRQRLIGRFVRSLPFACVKALRGQDGVQIEVVRAVCDFLARLSEPADGAAMSHVKLDEDMWQGHTEITSVMADSMPLARMGGALVIKRVRLADGIVDVDVASGDARWSHSRRICDGPLRIENESEGFEVIAFSGQPALGTWLRASFGTYTPESAPGSAPATDCPTLRTATDCPTHRTRRQHSTGLVLGGPRAPVSVDIHGTATRRRQSKLGMAFTTYTVVTEWSDGRFTSVERRYSDFRALRACVNAAAAFPSKAPFPLRDAVVRHRCSVLGAWLKAAIVESAMTEDTAVFLTPEAD
eukprot:TRINITY_DN10044_c0_g1_i1.p1 TRINITY_DN10044_c0_g1~~TRINITY_DN10044_c0_g1_i1.p1  ORF type:complete len:395 (+),score=134.34 TRINITY_DN10044_c0_g1_i1:441-1625(+)